MNKITRPALRYFGGKWNLGAWVVEHFPEHDCYVEPFGGAASVLLQKPRSFCEVYNDLNGRVVNFFRVLRERPEELVRAIQLTPYSREEYRLAHVQAEDALEDARRVAVIGGQGNRGMGTVDAGGWRWMSHRSRTATPAHEFYKTEHLYAIAERFQGVQVEHDEALKVMQRFDTRMTLFYVDPPYLAKTRCMRWQGDAYSFEMGGDEDHERLAAALNELDGMVVVSGYPNELYGRLFQGWQRFDHGVTMRVRAARGKGKPAVECLWVSPRALVRQGNLF